MVAARRRGWGAIVLAVEDFGAAGKRGRQQREGDGYGNGNNGAPICGRRHHQRRRPGRSDVRQGGGGGWEEEEACKGGGGGQEEGEGRWPRGWSTITKPWALGITSLTTPLY